MRYNYYGKSLACLAVMLGCATSGFAQVDVGTGSSKVTYSTLKEAVENAATGKTIYLTQDVTETGNISFTGKTLTLNLKGYKLTLNKDANGSANLIVGSGATLKVQGGLSATWSVDVNNDYKVTYQDKNGKDQGTLQLEGTIYAKDGGYVDVVSGNIVSTKTVALYAMGDQTGASTVKSKIFVEDGYVKAQEFAISAQGNGATVIIGQTSSSKAGPVLEALDNAVVGGNGTYTDAKKCGGTDITIRNATLIGRIQSPGYVACGIYHPQQGKLTIGYKAKIYAIDGCGILMRGGTMTMGGSASIVATGDKELTGKVGDSRVVVGASGIVYDYDCGYYDSKNVQISVKGYEATPLSITSSADAVSVINTNSADVSGNISLQNGLFSSDVSKFVDIANGYSCEKEGDVYHVANYVAQIGNVKWNNLRDAVANAKDGETVVVLKDYTALSYQLVPTHNVTLDLNGKYVKCHSVKVSGSSSKLTIKDGAASTISTYAAVPSDITTGLTGGVLEGVGSDGYTVLVEKGGIATLESGTVVNTYTKANTATTNVVFRAEGDKTQTSEVKSTVNINGGTVKTVGTPVFVAYKGATVNVNGGELEGSGLAAIAGNGSAGFQGTTINVTGGTLRAHAPSDGTASCGIYNPQDGVVNISGGTITSDQGPGILLRAGKLNVTGGEVVANGDASFSGKVGDAGSTVAASGIVFDRDANYSAADNTEVKIQGNDVKISGAKSAVELLNTNNVEEAKEAVRVVSGTFSSDVSEFTDNNATVKENTSESTYTVTSYMAQVGENKYASLADALNAIETEGTVTLLNDIDIIGANTKILAGKTITLDLNGNNVKAANCTADGIEVKGKLTLKDSKENSTARIYSESAYSSKYGMPIINIYENGEFVMESGKISAVMDDPSNNGQFGVGVWDNAKATIKGGTIEAGWYAIAGNGCYDTTKPVYNQPGTSTTLNIEGGTLVSTADYAIYHPQFGKLTVNDGTIYGNAGGIAMMRGELAMNGGTVTSKGVGNTGNWGDGTGNLNNAAIIVPARAYGDVTAKITAGKVIAEGDAVTIDAAASSKHNIDFAISGGTFSSDVSKYCADNYTAVPNADGTYGIETGDVVLVSDKSYQKVSAGETLEFTPSTINKMLINTEIDNVTVKMTKNFSTTNWSSFYAPFAITLTDALLQNYSFAKIWDTELVNDATTLEFKQLKAGDVIPAHTPCLVKANATGESVLEFPSVTIKKATATSIDCSTTEEKFTFVGTLEKTTLKDKNGYFVNPQTQQLTPAENDGLYVSPCVFYMTIQNRATGSYVYPSAASTQAKAFAFRVIGDGEITGISDIEQSASEKSVKIYNLQGVYVGNDVKKLQSGVYVINGKKVVVK